jgi:transposase-like protein
MSARDDPLLVEPVRPDVRRRDQAKAGRSAERYSNSWWHLNEVFVKINGERHYLWRAVDQKAKSWSPSSRSGGTEGRL